MDSILTIFQTKLCNVIPLFITEYSKTMEEELLKIPDKDLRHILVSLLNVDRPFTNKRADKMAAKERANQLYNDRDILSLLCEPVGRNQLKETLAAFLQLYRVDINQFIDENCSSLSTHAKDTLKDCGKSHLLETNTSKSNVSPSFVRTTGLQKILFVSVLLLSRYIVN